MSCQCRRSWTKSLEKKVFLRTVHLFALPQAPRIGRSLGSGGPSGGVAAKEALEGGPIRIILLLYGV